MADLFQSTYHRLRSHRDEGGKKALWSWKRERESDVRTRSCPRLSTRFSVWTEPCFSVGCKVAVTTEYSIVPSRADSLLLCLQERQRPQTHTFTLWTPHASTCSRPTAAAAARPPARTWTPPTWATYVFLSVQEAKVMRCGSESYLMQRYSKHSSGNPH